MKLVLVVLVLVLVSGCNRIPAQTWSQITVLNAPDERERKQYYEWCIGQSVYSKKVVADGLRVACVAAVLGNPTTHYEETKT